jgi:uncharacterized protein (TIGR00266 family)
MEFSIKHNPVFSILEVRLDEGETAVAQPNSMLSMTAGIQLKARAGRSGSKSSSGVLGGFKSLLGGENFFTTEFRAKRDGQTLVLAPDAYGDILTIPLSRHPAAPSGTPADKSSGFYLTRGSYLGNVGDCDLQIKYGGMKGVMAKTGLFLLHAAGTGTVFCQTYGAIVEHELQADENFFVDNRFVVAFSDTVQYRLVKATDSVKDSFFSGEGLINKFTGPGKLFYQTRGKPSEPWLARILGATV